MTQPPHTHTAPAAGRLCYISRRYRDRRTAGNKAKSDYEDILASAGAVNLGLPRSYGGGALLTFARNLAGVALAIWRMRRGDTLVLQYPVKKYFALLCRAARRKGVRTVALVHDLGAWRRSKLTPEQESRRLGLADTVAATNPAMARLLSDQGVRSRIISLGLHDYLSGAQPPAELPEGVRITDVAYAGSLNTRKNSFLKHLAALEGVNVVLYGRADSTDAPGLRTEGFVEPDAFIAGARAAWGLVWDGDSLDGCTGAWGDYLRVNTPHKSAFYLRAGLPLIVWSRSALAPIVRERGLGIVVDSLRRLPEAIAATDAETYRHMRHAALDAGSRAARGANLLAMLQKI